MKTLFPSIVGPVAAAACLFLGTARSEAVLISGNSVNDDLNGSLVVFMDFGHIIGTVDTQIAVGFTMPGQNYLLTDVLLRLAQYDGPSDSIVGIYLDNGTGLPGTLHALLTAPPAAGSPDNYIFSPVGSVILAANTKYWLLVDHEFGGGFEWKGAADSPTGVATFDGMMLSPHNGASYPVSITPPLRYSIHGTLLGRSSVVPDAGGTVILLGIALTAMAAGLRPKSGS